MKTFLLRLRASLATELTQTSILILIGLILRCYFIDRSPFWYDESFTALIVRLPFASMLAATASDVHPPFYYLLLKAWASFTSDYSPFGLRQLSALCSALALWQIDRLAVAYKLDRRIRLTVLALATFSPAFVFYAGEARSYALLQLLVVTVWIAVLERRWWLIALGTLVMLYTHNYGVIYGACLGLLALARALMAPRAIYKHGDSELAGTDVPAVLVSFLVPLMLFIPWVFYGMIDQFSRMNNDYWLSHVNPWSQVINTISLLMGVRAPAEFNLLLAVAVVGLLPPVLLSSLRARRLDWLLMLFGPIALAAGISLVKVIYLVRALTPILPAAYLIIAAALWQFDWRQSLIPKLTAAACVLVGLLAVLGTTYNGQAKYNPLVMQENVNIKPGIPVIHIGDFTAINWMASRPDLDNRLYISPCPKLPGELEPRTRSAMLLATVTPDAMPAEYYLVSYVGNLSNKCQEDQFADMAKGMQEISATPMQWGFSGVYYHAKR